MPLETFTYITSLVNTNPNGATDGKNEGDDHLRGIKTALLNSFPNIDAACTATPAQFNALSLITSALVEVAGAQIITGDKTFNGVSTFGGNTVLNGALSGTSVDTDTTLAANSDTKVASQKATKAYVDGNPSSMQNAALGSFTQVNVTTTTLTTLGILAYTPKYITSTIVAIYYCPILWNSTAAGSTNDLFATISLYDNTTLKANFGQIGENNVSSTVTDPRYQPLNSETMITWFSNTTGAALSLRPKVQCSDSAAGDNYNNGFNYAGFGRMLVFEIAP